MSIFKDCDRMRHLKQDWSQGIPRNNITFRNSKNRWTQPAGICKRGGKNQHWTNECRLTKDRQGDLITSENLMGGLLQSPIIHIVQPFQVSVENMSHQEN